MLTSKAATIGEGLAVFQVADDAANLDGYSLSFGGAEANVALGLAALGTPVSWISRVGDDRLGHQLVAALERRGVDTAGVHHDSERPTGLYLKERDAIGSRMRYYRQGSAASRFDPETLHQQSVAELISGCQLVHTSGITAALTPGSLAMVLALPELLAPGALFSFDVNWRPALWRGRESEAPGALSQIIRRADVVLLGDDEGLAVFGTADPDELRALFPQPERLVVKSGSRSAVSFWGSTRTEVAALSVGVVESIGAGDAFAAGYLAGVLQHLGEQASLRQGHLLAARTLLTVSDTAEVDPASDIAPFLSIDEDSWQRVRVTSAGAR